MASHSKHKERVLNRAQTIMRSKTAGDLGGPPASYGQILPPKHCHSDPERNEGEESAVVSGDSTSSLLPNCRQTVHDYVSGVPLLTPHLVILSDRTRSGRKSKDLRSFFG